MANVKKKPARAKAAPKTKPKVTKTKSGTKKPATKKAAPKKAASKPKGMPEQLLDAALKVLDERQAEEIVSLSLTGRSSLADYLIIASGKSSRQVAAIADHLRDAFAKLGLRKIHIEGQTPANWVLVDAGDVIVHLFLPEVRRYYDIDSLWNTKRRK